MVSGCRMRLRLGLVLVWDLGYPYETAGIIIYSSLFTIKVATRTYKNIYTNEHLTNTIIIQKTLN